MLWAPLIIPFQHTLEDSGSLYQLFLETFHIVLNWECTHARILPTNAGAVIWVGTFKTASLPLDWLSAQRDHSREFSNLPSDG